MSCEKFLSVSDASFTIFFSRHDNSFKSVKIQLSLWIQIVETAEEYFNSEKYRKKFVTQSEITSIPIEINRNFNFEIRFH